MQRLLNSNSTAKIKSQRTKRNFGRSNGTQKKKAKRLKTSNLTVKTNAQGRMVTRIITCQTQVTAKLLQTKRTQSSILRRKRANKNQQGKITRTGKEKRPRND